MTHDSPSTKEDALATALTLIRHIRIALLTTVDHDGTLHTRPVQTLQVGDDGTLWFFTDVCSAKAGELNFDKRISLGYADTSANCYVAVSGSGALQQDARRARELWHIEQRAFYPEGPDDPRLGVLRVRIERAEYWLAPGRPSYIYAALKATATGNRTGVLGEHARVDRRESE